MNWYYVDAGQQAGPVDDAQLEELVRSGKIQSDTLVWQEGMANWQPYSQVQPPAAPAAAPPAAPVVAVSESSHEAVCVECGKIFNKDDMIRHCGNHVCATCKPVFMQKLAEGAKISTGSLNYAGFWIRFAAKFVDGLILGVVLVAPFVYVIFKSARSPNPDQFQPAILIFQLGYYVVYAAYQIFFVGKYGATPGKMACKLRIVTADGNSFGYGRATGRFFAEILSGLVCYIGYIIAGFDEQKRALHDHICNTRVVYK